MHQENAETSASGRKEPHLGPRERAFNRAPYIIWKEHPVEGATFIGVAEVIAPSGPLVRTGPKPEESYFVLGLAPSGDFFVAQTDQAHASTVKQMVGPTQFLTIPSIDTKNIFWREIQLSHPETTTTSTLKGIAKHHAIEVIDACTHPKDRNGEATVTDHLELEAIVAMCLPQKEDDIAHFFSFQESGKPLKLGFMSFNAHQGSLNVYIFNPERRSGAESIDGAITFFSDLLNDIQLHANATQTLLMEMIRKVTFVYGNDATPPTIKRFFELITQVGLLSYAESMTPEELMNDSLVKEYIPFLARIRLFGKTIGINIQHHLPLDLSLFSTIAPVRSPQQRGSLPNAGDAMPTLVPPVGAPVRSPKRVSDHALRTHEKPMPAIIEQKKWINTLGTAVAKLSKVMVAAEGLDPLEVGEHSLVEVIQKIEDLLSAIDRYMLEGSAKKIDRLKTEILPSAVNLQLHEMAAPQVQGRGPYEFLTGMQHIHWQARIRRIFETWNSSLNTMIERTFPQERKVKDLRRMLDRIHIPEVSQTMMAVHALYFSRSSEYVGEIDASALTQLVLTNQVIHAICARWSELIRADATMHDFGIWASYSANTLHTLLDMISKTQNLARINNPGTELPPDSVAETTVYKEARETLFSRLRLIELPKAAHPAQIKQQQLEELWRAAKSLSRLAIGYNAQLQHSISKREVDASTMDIVIGDLDFLLNTFPQLNTNALKTFPIGKNYLDILVDRNDPERAIRELRQYWVNIVRPIRNERRGRITTIRSLQNIVSLGVPEGVHKQWLELYINWFERNAIDTSRFSDSIDALDVFEGMFLTLVFAILKYWLVAAEVSKDGTETRKIIESLLQLGDLVP